MKHILTVILLLTLSLSASGQSLSLTFRSITDAKFFVYLNGRLQNEKSSGMVTIGGLEEKDYHIRIVIDDPYAVAVTKRIKPSPKQSEYTVQFNPVRERVYVQLYKNDNKPVYWNDEPQTEVTYDTTANTQAPRSIRRHSFVDSASHRIVNRVRTNIIDE